MSRPMRARGLKLGRGHIIDSNLRSRPMRARGLKHWLRSVRYFPHAVAPHAGAWIETLDKATRSGTKEGRAPCGRVD